MTRTDEIDRARAEVMKEEAARACHFASERLQLAADYVEHAAIAPDSNRALAMLEGAERNANKAIAHLTRASALIAAEQTKEPAQ